MNERVALLGGFWSGKPFAYQGKHYNVDWKAGWPFTPVQQPRTPIWVVGAWPRPAPLRHALPYDGMIAMKMDGNSPFGAITPNDIRQATG